METLLNLLCPFPRGWEHAEPGAALVALSLCILASVKAQPLSNPLDQCDGCGYPREGIDAAAVCPECGRHAPIPQPIGTRLGLRRGWPLNFPLALGLIWLDIVLLRAAMLISYLLDHFRVSSAFIAMHRVDLPMLSGDLSLMLTLAMMFNPACLVFATPSLARKLMIAKTLLVGILALLAFGAPVGYP